MVVREVEPVENAGSVRGRALSPRFSVLGPLTVNLGDGAWTPVPGAKNRILLACLLLRVNQIVSVDNLARRLWGDHTPQDERRVVQTYVARLRQWLGDDGTVIQTRAAGYTIQLGPEQLDLLEFRHLLRRAGQADSPGQEAALLSRAAGLWRGAACEDVISEILHQRDVAVLSEERRQAVERRIDLDLSSGNASRTLIPELRMLTLEYPLRERHWAQLMRALHQAGRRAESLDAYRAAFVHLREELGVEPGPELRDLHQTILAGSPEPTTSAASPVTAAEAPEAAEPYPPREVPADVTGFVGRAAELDTLDQVMTRPGTTVIVGRAGVGKTTLAIHWATSASGAFPDGQLYLDLRGFDALPPLPPGQALRVLLHGLGVRPADIPAEQDAAAAMFRSRTAGRGMLIVLDNARDTRHVRPLLPGNGPSVIVTSRNQLRGLVTSGTAARIALGPLPPQEALDLLAGHVGHDRLRREPDQVRTLAALCEHLPLALRIVAERLARVPGLSAGTLVRDIERDVLAALRAGEGDPDIRHALSWSYQRLDPAARRTLRLAAVLHPGPVLEPEPLAALVQVPPGHVRRHLDLLSADHLVEQTAPERYRLPHLVRTHAAISPDERITRMDTQMDGHMLLPGDEGYDTSRSVWNAMVDRRPRVIMRCASVADVRAAVRVARERDLSVGVRCGGHSIVGHAVPDDGLMIDLTPLAAVRVDPLARRAVVQGGALLGALDTASQVYGLATTAGNVSHTGVGGLTLGGGMGWLARRYGLTCDNVTRFELVTADGELVRATPEINSELFWGLRGGGGNFGVVTEFEFALHKVGTQAFVAEHDFDAATAGQAMRAWRDLSAAAPREATFNATVADGVATLGWVWAGDPGQARHHLSALKALGEPLAVRAHEISYLDLQRREDSAEGHTFRRYWKGHYFAELTDEAIEGILLHGIGRHGVAASIQQYGGAIAEGSDSAFAHRSAAFEYVAAAKWSDPAEDETRMADARLLAANLAPHASGAYVNVLSDDDNGIGRVYDQPRMDRLRALKRAWDPGNIFRHNHNITP
ncbi:BTAD domain-containing putative transcriptional regulator [Nonomuraea sp. NPDC050790]|uniref:BTAD domain-containing putative transcriptional regulator n=1 Tax=Nonomuraea sp. NPDC050790 TaxID=3364371 RepID=UPI0037919867